MSNKRQSDPSALFYPGLIFAGIGIFLASAMYHQPEQLQIPMSVAMMACACFVFAGIAMALQARGFTWGYQFAIVCLLGCMTAIPAWIGFWPGESHCTSNMPLFGGQFGCRVAFGFSTLIMAPILLIAIKQLLGKRAG
jgi:hypothetical protein